MFNDYEYVDDTYFKCNGCWYEMYHSSGYYFQHIPGGSPCKVRISEQEFNSALNEVKEALKKN